MKVALLACCLGSLASLVAVRGAGIEASSLAEFATATAGNAQNIRLKPGTYRMADYLTAPVLAAIEAGFERKQRRPPVPMLVLRGNDNRIDCTGVILEIDTTLYAKLPQGGYTRCLIIAGSGNTISGLTIRNTGPVDRGSNGNILSVAGERNTLEEVTLHVAGSSPYGYGDLLGKGGPNLMPLQKQSGIQILGSGTTLRRCKVVSRAFGHCFYIQAGENILLEDCEAEGAFRSTTEMLGDASGPAFDLGFRSVYRNRDGRFAIAPGYVKSLSEDGFRTYGGVGSVTLVNCTATNTRSGFEIGARDDAKVKTIIENCVARGCERAFLIGSHTVVRRSRGDIVHGPLLYLRGGRESDVELELIGDAPQGLVHFVATIAGQQHRVSLTAQPSAARYPALPILAGYGMPPHAEMSSNAEPAPTEALDFGNTIAFAPVIVSDLASGAKIESVSRVFTDAELRKDPGSWGLPANGVAGSKQ